MNRHKEELARAIVASGAKNVDLANLLGVEPSFISQLKTKRKLLPADKAVKMAEFLGVQPEAISEAYEIMARAGGAPPRIVRIPAYEIEAVENDENFDPEKEIWVQGVDIEVSAGPGRVVPEFVPTSYRQRFTLKWLRDVGAKAEDLRVLRVVGDSMEPLVYEGDKVTIDLARKKVESGRVYVIVSGGEAKVKRLFRSADGRIRIVSDNADKAKYPDEYVGQDDDGFLVIGRVVDKSGRGGL